MAIPLLLFPSLQSVQSPETLYKHFRRQLWVEAWMTCSHPTIYIFRQLRHKFLVLFAVLDMIRNWLGFRLGGTLVVGSVTGYFASYFVQLWLLGCWSRTILAYKWKKTKILSQILLRKFKEWFVITVFRVFLGFAFIPLFEFSTDRKSDFKVTQDLILKKFNVQKMFQAGIIPVNDLIRSAKVIVFPPQLELQVLLQVIGLLFSSANTSFVI